MTINNNIPVILKCLKSDFNDSEHLISIIPSSIEAIVEINEKTCVVTYFDREYVINCSLYKLHYLFSGYYNYTQFN